MRRPVSPLRATTWHSVPHVENEPLIAAMSVGLHDAAPKPDAARLQDKFIARIGLRRNLRSRLSIANLGGNDGVEGEVPCDCLASARVHCDRARANTTGREKRLNENGAHDH